MLAGGGTPCYLTLGCVLELRMLVPANTMILGRDNHVICLELLKHTIAGNIPILMTKQG